MAWQQALGGLVSGLGQGLIMQAQMDGLRLRDERLAELEKERDKRNQEFQASQTEKAQTFAHNEGELTREQQLKLNESDQTFTAGQNEATRRQQRELTDLSEKNAIAREDRAATRDSAELGEAFADSEGRMWRQPKGGGPAVAVMDKDGNQVQAYRKPEDRSKEAQSALDTAIKLFSDPQYGSDDPDTSTTDWNKVYEYLHQKGFDAEADAAKAKAQQPDKPADEPGPAPKGDGLISRLGDYFLGGEKPSDPGTAVAGETPQTAPPIPRRADGTINEERLQAGQLYSLPDGTTYRWTGSSFNPARP